MTDAAQPRATVLYNAPSLPASHPDAVSESDVCDVARSVAAALGDHGFATELLAAGPPIDALLGLLRASSPEVVFNLIEGFAGSCGGETLVTGLIELSGLAYTGCPPEALCWCLSKSRTKALLRGLGLPTAPFAVIEPAAPVPDWPGPWPVIVKPDAEDASLGIDQQSVASDRSALIEQVDRVRWRHGGRVLVEAYLPGSEFNVGLLALPEPEPLPIAEVVYARGTTDWPILTYESKWVAGSTGDLASVVHCPAQIDEALAGALGRLAVAAFNATSCRDYARVDFRLDAQGEPMILEVNPNPDLGPSAGWARAVKTSGRDYSATLAALARQAMNRRSAFAAGVRHGGSTP